MKGQSVNKDAVLGRPADPAGRRLGPRLQKTEFRAWMPVVRMLVREGNLRIRYRGETEAVLGNGKGPLYTIDVDSCRLFRKATFSPDLALGEGYMDGVWRTPERDLAKVIGLLLKNQIKLMSRPPLRMVGKIQDVIASLRRLRNDPGTSRANAAHHYDIGNDLYRVFLDPDMNYSCAFFENRKQGLAGAQKNKIRTTAKRLEVGAGMSVLDIGCGWGAMTRYLAEETPAEFVTGITLASEQLAFAKQSALPEHGNRLRYLLADYRDHAAENPDRYDRIVSIGMFEHVGRPQFDTYFQAIERMLRPGGRALVHTIICPRKNATSPWIDKYIFPGGYIPTLQELTRSGLHTGLKLVCAPYVQDSFHYANTLRHWRKRFGDAFPNLNHQRYDERFRRMWNFYLAGSEAAFDAAGFNVAQAVFEKPN